MNPQNRTQDIKRALLADPRRSTPEGDSDIADDVALATMRRQLVAGNEQLAAAFAEVDAPPGLAERIILRVRYRRRSTWVVGIAASVLVAALTLLALRPEAPSSIAVAMLDHVVEGTDEMANEGNVSASAVAASLERLGVGFRDAGYRVRHLAECVVAGRTGRHLVMNTPNGLVSFLILPTMKGEVGARQELSRGGMQAIFLVGTRPGAEALPAVAIGAFAEKGIDPKAMEAMLQQMFPATGAA